MNSLLGVGVLVRHALRRDRFANTLWVSLLSLTAAATARRYGELFATDAARDSFARAMEGNRALQAFGGQLFSHSLGSLVLFKAGASLYNLVALMALLAVIRHTRAEEEQGRHELLASGAVGRLAPVTAALLSTWFVCLLVGVLTGAGLVAAGLPATGSALFGMACALLGCFAAAAAAVFAQLTPSASRARALAGASLGASFVVRFVADGLGAPWLRWLSPEGWCHEARAFAGDRAAPLVLLLALSLALAALAARLASSRELGAGVLGDNARRDERSPPLTGPLSLALRLQRGSLWAWALGLGATGALLGSMAQTLPALAERSGPAAQEFLRRYGANARVSITDTFLWLVVLTLGYTVALYPVLAVLRLRTEEQSGRAELLLSTSVSRVRWASSHALIALIGPLVALTVAGLAMGLAYGAGAHDLATQVPRVLLAALLQAPAAWTLGGVTMLAFGAAPRWSVGLGWAAFIGINTVGEVLGPALGVDYWLANRIVPFHHLPRVLTGEPFAWTPVLALCAFTAATSAIGLAMWRRRDLAS